MTEGGQKGSGGQKGGRSDLVVVSLVAAVVAVGVGAFSVFGADAARDGLGALLTLATKVVKAVGLTDPIFYLAVAGILVLERLRPVDPVQPALGRAFLFDGSWVFVRLVGTVLVLTPFVGFVAHVYDTHLAFLTVPGTRDLPSPWRFVFGILAADLVAWFHHYVRHKVAWPFHAVHHSQRELNLFTDDRNHVVDLWVSAAVRTVPMLMFSVETPNVVAWTLFGTWFTRLYHANIRSDFGWLRYVLVTPQFHRIHHSTDPRHHERNFGLIFTFWDRLFGTHHDGFDEYPATGIDDSDFPIEQGGLAAAVVALCRQQFYPFVSAFRNMRRALAGGASSDGGSLQ